MSERTSIETTYDTGRGGPRQGLGGLTEQMRWTTIRFVKLTRQGVRDLNGPRLNGTGYNGRRDTTCMHHKAPDIAPRHTLVETGVSADSGLPVDMRYDCCSICGEKLGEVER